MSVKEALLKELESETAITKKVIAEMPEGKADWAPHEKSMTLKKLVGHVVDTFHWGWTTIAFDNRELTDADMANPFWPETADVALAKLEEYAAAFKTALEAMPEEALAVQYTMSYKGRTFIDMPRGECLRTWVFSHMIHHRGQLSVYLRLLGARVPGIYGPSADDKMGM
jgi:uncharacterized damage-inducible protein DinB